MNKKDLYSQIEESEFISICKDIEVYIQSNENYKNSIIFGNFSTRFYELFKKIKQTPK